MSFQSELKAWKLEAAKICEKYSISPPKHIVWNRRLRTTAGQYRAGNKWIVELSTRYRQEYGWERSNGTFLHEMAHHIVWVKYGQRGHCHLWKMICKELGGTMNRKLAGYGFAESGTDKYIKTPWKYKYTCPCGATYKRKRRIQIKAGLTCGKCRTSVRNFKMEELNDGQESLRQITSC